jgi:hypothetical protein
MAYREAAAVDAAVAASLREEHRRRLESFGAIIGMLPADRLRHSPQECADTAWALASADVFLLLRTVRDWNWDKIRAWLAATLVDVLLEPLP